jgi:hypothetical protein
MRDLERTDVDALDFFDTFWPVVICIYRHTDHVLRQVSAVQAIPVNRNHLPSSEVYEESRIRQR